MSAKFLFATVSTILCAAMAASAAPPPGKGGGNDKGDGEDPPSTFDPEIAHRVLFKRGKGQGLYLTDRETSHQVEVARSNDPIVGFDLASERIRTIAYPINGAIYLRSWQVDPFVLGPEDDDPLFTTNLRLSNVDFSRDDSKLVWATRTPGAFDTIYIHDFTTGETTPQPLGGHQVAHIRFSPVDDTIVFTGSATTATGHDGVYRYIPGSTTALRFILRAGNYYDTNMDVTRPSQSGQPLIVLNSENLEPQFFNFSGHKVSLSFAGEGEKYTFNCDNSALLYLETGLRKGGLAITPFGGAIEILDIPSDKHSDWMPRVPCE